MNKGLKVYLTEPIHAEASALLEKHVDLIVEKGPIPKGKLLQRVVQVDILFNKTDTSPVDKEVIDKAKALKYIARHGSGYSNVDVAYATRKRIPVSYTPGANAHSVAEYTFGLILMVAKKLLPALRAARRGMPERRDFVGTELYEKTLGVIGVGQIGREVVKLGQGFGMKILAYHPRPSAAKLADLRLELVDLDELLQRSDIISIHARLTPETQGLIGRREISLMKKSGILVNMGRGEMVDEEGLVEALRANRIIGAAVDVVTDEPVKKSNALLGLGNALVSPHISSMTVEAQRRTAMMAVEDILRFVRGQRPKFVVNPEVYVGLPKHLNHIQERRKKNG